MRNGWINEPLTRTIEQVSTVKIAFFGDSLTWGGYGGNYVDEVRQHVGDKHEIVNAGEGGNTVINLSRRLERDVLAHEPDTVLIMVGGNDAMSHSQPDTRPYYRKSQDIPNGHVTPADFRRTYRHILGELQVNHIHAAVALEPIETNPTVAAALRQYNAIAREEAVGHNVPVLDLFAHFVPEHIPQRRPINLKSIRQVGVNQRTGWTNWYEAQREGDYTYSFDGVHWTPETAAEVARLVVDFLDL